MSMTSFLRNQLTFLILQFLDEEKFENTLHMLEQESGLFFNLKYFEKLVLSGSWDEAEKYLLAFTRLNENEYSVKAFFEIRKQKYLEALDKLDRAKAVNILLNDLKVFSSSNEELFKEMTQLLILDNFRENKVLSTYRDTQTARSNLLVLLKQLLNANIVFRGKLVFPDITNSRLGTLVNQSLNWQHSLCTNPRENPDITSLFEDHKCRSLSDLLAQLSASATPKVDGYLPVGGAIGASSSSNQSPFTRVPNSLTLMHPALAASINNINLSQPGGLAKGPETSNMASHLPLDVVRILNERSNPTSMDFHPVQQTLLLVGTSDGIVSLWEISRSERLVSTNFGVWDFNRVSTTLMAALIKDAQVSVRRILWNSDGSIFGVAYSKHMIQLYSYHGASDVRRHFEVDAHVGNVNDLAFCNLGGQPCVITCGEDKTIKVWDVATCALLGSFEGHEAPVYSVCPFYKPNMHYVFSTSVDGKIKLWLYETKGSVLDCDVPGGQSCTTMAYSSDGRLFSCGTNEYGVSYIVEWNDQDATIKRRYQGFDKVSPSVVQFDTTRNQFLAAGDDHAIKFWHMDNINLLTTVDTGGGLPATPRIRFNKEGFFLAVSANDNRIKVLATLDGQRMIETLTHLATRIGPEPLIKNAFDRPVIHEP